MNDFEFNILVTDSLPVLIAIIVAVGLIYYYSIKKYCLGILDPFALGFFAACMATVVVVFLYAKSKISLEILLLYIVIELAFIFGFVFLSSNFNYRKKIKISDLSRPNFYSQYRINTYAIYFTIQIITYILVGIPILTQESRLEIYNDMKLLGWLVDGATFNAIVCIAVTISLNEMKGKKLKSIDYFMIAFCLVSLLTKGGKSDFILLIITIFIAAKITGNIKLTRYIIILIPAIAVIMVILTQFILHIWGVDASAIELILRRLLAFGDIYYLGLSKEISLYFDDNSIFFRLLPSVTSLLNNIGLIHVNLNENTPVGYVIYEHYYGVNRGAGPNPRMTYILMTGMGFFGVIGSLIYGVGIAWLRYGIFRYIKSFINFHYYILITTCAFYAFIDPMLWLVFTIKSTLFFVLILLITALQINCNPRSCHDAKLG